MKMTAAEAVETSVTNNLSQDYSNLDDLLSLTCINVIFCAKTALQIFYSINKILKEGRLGGKPSKETSIYLS